MTAARLVTMGKCYMEEYDYEMAYRCFLDAALQNNADAILNLGIMYLCGSEVVQQDFVKAFHYLKLDYEMTGIIRTGFDVSEARIEILESIEGKEAYRDYIEFLINNQEWHYYIIKGEEYRDNGLYPKSVEEEIKCYQEAWKHGVSMGLECLAEMYYAGRDVKQDYKKAYELLQSYDGSASFTKDRIIGEMYYYGRYLEKDVGKAVEIFKDIINSDNPWREYDRDYTLVRELLGKIEMS